jgi:hypothetical protein
LLSWNFQKRCQEGRKCGLQRDHHRAYLAHESNYWKIGWTGTGAFQLDVQGITIVDNVNGTVAWVWR